MRESYLASLSEPQEWFLEELVQAGEVWETPGSAYAVFNRETLVEFHSARSGEMLSRLSELKSSRPFEQVLCKSFDRFLLDAATGLGGTCAEHEPRWGRGRPGRHGYR